MSFRHLMSAALASAVVLAASFADAATMAPEKGYSKPGEPIVIRFLAPTADRAEQAKAALEAIGVKAAEIPGLFEPAPAADLVEQAGTPTFTLHSFDGKLVEPKAAKQDLSKGAVDVAAYYPQIRDGGTFILSWKDATPLVIQARRGAMPWGILKSRDVPPQVRAHYQQQAKAGAIQVIAIRPLEFATITTDKGEMKATFYYDVAPNTVNNFITLAKAKFYDGSAFHRIIKGFMIQGGDSLANTAEAGTGGPGYQINAELSEKKHERGTLSMARSPEVNSAGSQFFVVHQRSEHLDNEYTAFGQVFAGLDALDKIADTPAEAVTGAVKQGSRPKIESIRIRPATLEMYGIKK